MMIDGYVAEILNNQIMKDINAKKATDKEFADYIHAHSVPINLVNNAVVKALEEVKAEIEAKMESIIGKYDSSTPPRDMPSKKCERNCGRQEAVEIIDRKIAEVTKNDN